MFKNRACERELLDGVFSDFVAAIGCDWWEEHFQIYWLGG
jgi:hypothetical protein